MQQPRTLRGKVFLDKPISGATVRIYDRSGFLLYSVENATEEDGAFSITRKFPESFTVVIKGGVKAGASFGDDVSAWLELFDASKHYKINAVTTLLAGYHDRHPEIPHADAKDCVEAFLTLPESVDLDHIIYSSEWYCYYFSHYLFMREARAYQGVNAFVDRLLDELDEGKTESFYDALSIGSSLFQDAMSALLKGAMSELGKEGTGWILGLLNQGGSDIDNRLSEMQDDLQQVLNDLSEVITAVTALAGQLAMNTTQIETYIEGSTAQDAITVIKTHYGPDDKDSQGDTNTLKYFSFLTSADSNPTTKAEMASLVGYINGSWDIENQVQTIHDAIIPDIGNTDGLLDLWTKTFLLQGPVDSDTLMSYYVTLEQYFSVLLFYQFKGANLVVEAMNYQSSTGELPLLQDGSTPASSYLTGTFQPMLQQETDRFLQCVLQLIFNNCALYLESQFLPTNTKDILARATFFIIQTLGEDHYGLRTGAIGTQNIVNEVFVMGAGEYGVVADASVDTELSYRPYDSWGNTLFSDLKNLTSGDVYTYKYFDLYPYAEDPGTYKMWVATASGNSVDVGEAEVKKYTPSYIEDDVNGTISYGYCMAPFRVGGKEAMMDPSVFVQDQYTVDSSGSVTSSDVALLDEFGNLLMNVTGSNNDDDASSNLSQKLEWYHPFTFTGSQATTAYLSIGAMVQGSAYWFGDNGSGNECSIQANFGLWDVTHNVKVKSDSYGVSASNWDTKSLDVNVNDQLSVTLQPGVSYYVYVNVTGSGSANFCEGVTSSNGYSYTITLYLNFLGLTFVDSEFGSLPTVSSPLNLRQCLLPLRNKRMAWRLRPASE